MTHEGLEQAAAVIRYISGLSEIPVSTLWLIAIGAVGFVHVAVYGSLVVVIRAALKPRYWHCHECKVEAREEWRSLFRGCWKLLRAAWDLLPRRANRRRRAEVGE